MPNPTQDQLNTLAKSLARTMSYCPADYEDLVQEALFGACLAFRRFKHPRRPFAFARTIMRRAMISYYNRNQPGRYVSLEHHPLEYQTLYHATPLRVLDYETPYVGFVTPARQRAQMASLPFDPSEHELDHDLLLEQYFTALQSSLGLLPRRIAENLIAPNDPAVCAFAIEASARKERANKSRTAHHQLRGVKHIRISQQQIREAMGFTRSEWSHNLRDIRAFTRSWLILTHSQRNHNGNSSCLK